MLNPNEPQLAIKEVRFAVLTAFHLRIHSNERDLGKPTANEVRKLERSPLGLDVENFLDEYDTAYQWVYGKWQKNIVRLCLHGCSLVLEANLGLVIKCKVSLAVFPRNVGMLEIFFEINESCSQSKDRHNTSRALNTDQIVYFRHLLLEQEPLDQSFFNVIELPQGMHVKQNNFSGLVALYIDEICEILGGSEKNVYPVDTVTSIQLASFADESDLIERHQISKLQLRERSKEIVGILQADEDWRSLKADYLDKYFAASSVYFRKKYLIALSEYSDTLVICTSYKDSSRLLDDNLWNGIYDHVPRVAKLYRLEPDDSKTTGGLGKLANLKNQHVLYDEFSLYIRFLLLRIRSTLESSILSDLSIQNVVLLQKQCLSIANEIESMELLRRDMLRAASLNKMLEATFTGREIDTIEQTIDRKLEILGNAIDRETLFASERANRALSLLGVILAAGFGFEVAKVVGYFVFLGEFNAEHPSFIWQYGILNVVFFISMLLLLVLYFILTEKVTRRSRE